MSTRQALACAIPAAAWARGIGVPYETPGRARVAQPLIDDGPWGGAPLGGLGAGAIGRTFRGDFARWHLDIGAHRFESLPACQFSVFVQQGGRSQAHALAPLRPETLAAWNWDMPVGAGTYYALFPKAWFVYDWGALPVRLAQKQFSPIIPGNYRESSYPVVVFEWEAHNPTAAPLTVGLMFTWQNLAGLAWGRDGTGNWNQGARRDGLTGVVLSGPGAGAAREAWEGTFALLAPETPGVTASYRARFLAHDGADVWLDFAEDGRLDDVDDRRPAAPGEALAGALGVTFELQPGETRRAPFALAWDFPITQFGAGAKWHKRYTEFYGRSGRGAWEIAANALAEYPAWEAAIDGWQAPILADPARPEWYKTALFNELYYLVDGGTFWEAGRADGGPAPPETGHFAFLECYDYPFYNTFDVNFYSSFALLLLWPELEKSIIRDFARTVPLHDPTPVQIEATGAVAERKTPGAIPHDLGGPPEDPLLKINYYRWQDINLWKDLNSKFVLQLWRDTVVTGDKCLAREAWPAVAQALAYLKRFDRDGDGLPEHDNLPDQTYDTWPMNGASAYGGSLWLAALEAAIELGKIAGADTTEYAAWLAAGRAAFEEKLWNGRYYNYDAGGGPHSDSIMADQLAGQWYADATGLAPIAPEEHILSALCAIYDNNVLRFAEGQMGAVNGMRPDGAVDESSEQSPEVWAGTTYALAAFMLSRGLRAEAWRTAWGVYNVVYNRGYWFRTPEAYDIHNNFRASMYMRPLSVWAIEHALKAEASRA